MITKKDRRHSGYVTPRDVVSKKITETEADKLSLAAINSGFNTKIQIISGVNRLLKTNIKELTELTISQARSVEAALLMKKNKNK